MPGYSLTAHVFDDVAPKPAGTHRVIALTLRGFGESDAPDDSAYSIATLVDDLRAVLDSLHVGRATLVAHSLSGTVAARFALLYPARVSRLVLLHAFPYVNEEEVDSVDALSPGAPPEFKGDTTYAAVARYLAKYRFVPWRPALLADLRAKPLEPEAGRRHRLTANYIADQWRNPPALGSLTIPSVQVCAVPTTESEFPWLLRGRQAFARAQQYTTASLAPLARRLCARYARTVALGDTGVVRGSHYVFFTQPSRTAALLRRLLK